VAIHFGGAEPTLRWREIDRGVRRARELARTLGKGAELHLSTNGQTLDAERIAFLAEHAVVVRLSLDGTPETQAIGRPGKRDQDTYGRLPEVIAGLRAAGVYSEVTMVAHPAVVDRVAASFDHLVSLGVQEITISVASGVGWADHARKRLLVELGKIEAKYYRDTFVGASAWLQNARDADFVKRMYSREVAIDHAGDVHCGNAFLLSGPLGSDPLRLGHIDEGRTIDEWMARRPPLKDVLTNMYPAGLLRNNYLVHRAMGLWVRALRARFESEMCSIGDADAYDFEDVLGFDTGPEPHRALPVVR
jgi:MoaA/NifB/PqqE/SkfB family radical SAM enzyme